jgi:hypothetical protein
MISLEEIPGTNRARMYSEMVISEGKDDEDM